MSISRVPHPLCRRLALALALVSAAAFAQSSRRRVVAPPDPSSFPTAVSDSFSVRQGHVLLLSTFQGVLANDFDPPKKPLTAVLITTTRHGALVLNADGSLAYAHDGSSDPFDSFLYYATDGTAGSNPARATITITPDHAPVGINDSYATGPTTQLTVAAPGVFGNDSDADNDVLTASLVAPPAHGTLTLNADGSFIYTPDGTKSPDSFTYVATDGLLQSAETTVSIAIDTSVHANVDTYPATENTPRAVEPPGVLGNDVLNGGKITGYGAASGAEQSQIGAATGTAGGGTVTLNADGSFRFTPAPNFTGADTFKYTLANSDGKASSVVMMMIYAPPVASADAYDIAGGAASVHAPPGVLANDTVNGAVISGYGAASGSEQKILGSPTPTSQGGSVTLRADGSFTYMPPAKLLSM